MLSSWILLNKNFKFVNNTPSDMEELQYISNELKPIHLYDNYRFLVRILYGFHPLTLKYYIFTNWIWLIPMG